MKIKKIIICLLLVVCNTFPTPTTIKDAIQEITKQQNKLIENYVQKLINKINPQHKLTHLYYEFFDNNLGSIHIILDNNKHIIKSSDELPETLLEKLAILNNEIENLNNQNDIQ